MAFDKLRDMGKEKFDKILNLLMCGEPAMAVARLIQAPPPTGWAEMQGIAEKTLTQQLLRLRTAAAEGAFGPEMAKQIADGARPQITMLMAVSRQAIDRLEELSDIQRLRVFSLVEKEQSGELMPGGNLKFKMHPTEYRHLLTQTNAVFNDYKQLLLDIQKVRFDLGLDEFKGPVTGTSIRGATQTTTFPDGMSVQKQVFEAVTTLEQIFENRQIPAKTRVN